MGRHEGRTPRRMARMKHEKSLSPVLDGLLDGSTVRPWDCMRSMEPMTIGRVKRSRHRFGVDVMSWRAFLDFENYAWNFEILGDELMFKVVSVCIQGSKFESIMSEKKEIRKYVLDRREDIWKIKLLFIGRVMVAKEEEEEDGDKTEEEPLH